MISMKDIAKECGVSIATVSKALNDHSDIGEATKKLVCDTAKRLGYLPNSSARALKTNRTYNIGVLFVDDDDSGLRHDYFSHILNSFKVTAEDKGYDITFIGRKTAASYMTYYEHSLYRGIDGVVIAAVNFDNSEVIELANGRLPVVTIDYAYQNRTAVMSDNALGMRQLVSYIHSLGHSKIAYICGNDTAVTKVRVQSFMDTMKEYGLDVPPEYLKRGAYRDAEITSRLTAELLSLKERPTCIIYPDDFSAFGGINMIKSFGLSIPNDISIAGYDGLNIAKIVEPKLTTIEQDSESLGREAALHLIKQIEDPDNFKVEKVVIQGKLLTGNSVRRLV